MTTKRDVKQAVTLRLLQKSLNLLSQPEAEGTQVLVEVLGRLFDTEANKSAFLWRCSLFRNACQPLPAKYPEPTPEEAQLSAQLAVYYGMSLESGYEGLEGRSAAFSSCKARFSHSLISGCHTLTKNFSASICPLTHL